MIKDIISHEGAVLGLDENGTLWVLEKAQDQFDYKWRKLEVDFSDMAEDWAKSFHSRHAKDTAVHFRDWTEK